MKKHQKFLKFNGKNLLFLNKDGVYWIALKPICEALGIDARRAREMAKNDPILRSVVSNQTLQTLVFRKDIGSVNQPKSMMCLPEKYIYGWLFSLNSTSQKLIEYKRTCYELLYNHFHGTITNRKELLVERIAVDTEIHELTEELRQNDVKFQKLHDLKNKRKLLSTHLNTIDKELVEQPTLFENN